MNSTKKKAILAGIMEVGAAFDLSTLDNPLLTPDGTSSDVDVCNNSTGQPRYNPVISGDGNVWGNFGWTSSGSAPTFDQANLATPYTVLGASAGTAGGEASLSSLSGVTSICQGGWLNNDGTVLYVLGSGNGIVHRCTKSAGSATLTSTSNYSNAGALGGAKDISVKPDETKALIMINNGDIIELNMSSAGDLSTGSLGNSLDWSSLVTDTGTGFDYYGFAVSADGTKIFALARQNTSMSSEQNIYQFTLSSAWEPDTASLDFILDCSNFLSSSEISGIEVSEEGRKLYLLDGDSATILETDIP